MCASYITKASWLIWYLIFTKKYSFQICSGYFETIEMTCPFVACWNIYNVFFLLLFLSCVRLNIEQVVLARFFLCFEQTNRMCTAFHNHCSHQSLILFRGKCSILPHLTLIKYVKTIYFDPSLMSYSSILRTIKWI